MGELSWTLVERGLGYQIPYSSAEVLAGEVSGEGGRRPEQAHIGRDVL